MCLLRFSLGLGEKPTLQVGIIAKKVAGATAGSAILQGLVAVQAPAPHQHLPLAPHCGVPPCGRTENVNPRNPVRLRTQATFRKPVRLSPDARARSGASEGPPGRGRRSARRAAAARSSRTASATIRSSSAAEALGAEALGRGAAGGAGRSTSGSNRRTASASAAGLAALEERPRHALGDALAHPALAQRDHRAAGGQRLDRRDPELLRRGHDQRARAREQLGDALVADPAGERDASARRCAAAAAAPARRRPRRSGRPSALNARTATSIRLCAISSASTM